MYFKRDKTTIMDNSVNINPSDWQNHTHDGLNSQRIKASDIEGSSSIEAFKVGGVYINTTGTNPNSELGYGTWVAFAQGKVLVGYLAGDPDFGTGGATGGEKTHTLSLAEIPAHTHTVPTHAFAGGATDLTTQSGNTPGSLSTSSAGGGGAHNNLQPFIVVFIWNRTA